MALFAETKEPFIRECLDPETAHSAATLSVACFAVPIKFHAGFQRVTAASSKICQGVIAIGGKGLRQPFDRASGKSGLYMVRAWDCE